MKFWEVDEFTHSEFEHYKITKSDYTSGLSLHVEPLLTVSHARGKVNLIWSNNTDMVTVTY